MFIILQNIAVFIELIPLAIFIYYRAFNSQLKALLIYCILSFIADTAHNILSRVSLMTHFTLINTYASVETVIILYIYYHEFRMKSPYLLIMIGFAYLFLSFGNFSTQQYSDITSGFQSIIIITLSIIYFFRLSSNLTIPKLTNYYFFWINTAFLVYFSITSIIFLSINYIRLLNTEEFRVVWDVNLITNILYNILLSIGIYKFSISQKQVQSESAL